MADWQKAKLGDAVEHGGQWWRTIVVPVDGPDDDPRKAPPAAPASRRLVPRKRLRVEPEGEE